MQQSQTAVLSSMHIRFASLKSHTARSSQLAPTFSAQSTFVRRETVKDALCVLTARSNQDGQVRYLQTDSKFAIYDRRCWIRLEQDSYQKEIEVAVLGCSGIVSEFLVTKTGTQLPELANAFAMGISFRRPLFDP